MTTTEIISSGLLELYAMGIASGEESAQVENWTAQYPEVKAELEKIEASLEVYARAHELQPSPSVKDKILSSITPLANERETIGGDHDSRSSIVYKMPGFFKMAAAAVILLLLASVAFNYFYYNKYRDSDTNLQLAQKEIAKKDSLNLAMNKDIEVMTDKNSMPVVLKGTPHSPDALAKIFWMKNTGDVYIDPSYLPEVPAGKQYQLWAIVDGKPVDGGMITTEKGTYHIQKMKSFGKVEAFAITLEKAGGSPTPTMEEMFVISKI